MTVSRIKAHLNEYPVKMLVHDISESNENLLSSGNLNFLVKILT